MDKINTISIITVCYNCKNDLDKTIKSVTSQTYKNIEFIIIDGNSGDGTQDLVKTYNDNINFFISEPDEGIYDAMNKGIKISTSEWLLFMNAGDTFYNNDVLKDIFANHFPTNTNFIYSDYYIQLQSGKIIKRKTNRHMGIVHHQSAIYRRKLHNEYGYYIVTHPYIISDLMFFLSIPEEQFSKIDIPIAKIEDGGVSSGTWSRKQANCIRYIYGFISFGDIFLDYFRMNLGIFIRKLFNICKTRKN